MKTLAKNTVLMCGASLLISASALADAGGSATFDTEYTGSFTMSFGSGPDGTNELDFAGNGRGTQVGRADIDGSSLLQSIDPLCMVIVEDLIVMTAANGDEVHVEAEATDCLEFTAAGPQIVGSGTWEIIGGTGRFADATGGGTQSTVAPIYDLGATSASGVFTLTFEGVIEHGE